MYLTLCILMDCSTPGFTVLHQLPELAQTHVHQVGNAIKPFHSVIPFSSCLQSFPASRSFLISQLLASCDRNIGASASVLPMNIQDLFPLGWIGWIPLQCKGLSRVSSNTKVQKHQFFSAQLSLRRKQRQPTPVLLPGTSHGRRSLVGYSPWGH